ncbi:MAG TPA: flagellar basal body L-ring protein FlgH [Planctomycetota bacterium]|nr:flagellar basal body L-ring protein FlgH [Planctomycetota bacterium]
MKRGFLVLGAFLAMAGGAWAQSLLEQTSRTAGTAATPGAGPYDAPKRLPFKRHDHLQIVVDEKSHALSSTQLQTDRRTRWDTELTNWIQFKGGKLLPQLQPRGINAGETATPAINLDARLRQDNTGTTGRDLALTFTIMAEVIDVRPNGTLVVQAIKRRKVNADTESIKLTGEVAPQSIVGDKVSSDYLVNLTVVYEGDGSVSDVAKPGVLGWILTKFWPF